MCRVLESLASKARLKGVGERRQKSDLLTVFKHIKSLCGKEKSDFHIFVSRMRNELAARKIHVQREKNF